MYSHLCLIVFCACATAAPQLPLQTLFAEVPTRVLGDDSANSNTTFTPSTATVAISAISEMTPEPSTEPAISSEDSSTMISPSEQVSERTEEVQTTINPSGSEGSTEGPVLNVVPDQEKRTESVPVAEESSTEAVIIVEPVMNIQSSTSNAELVFPVGQGGMTTTSTVPSTTMSNSTVKNETRTQPIMPEINVTVELNLPTDLHVSAESLFIEPTIINSKDGEFERKMMIRLMKNMTPEPTSEKPVEQVMNRTASYIQMPRGFAMASTTEKSVSAPDNNPEPSSEIAVTVPTNEPVSSTQSTQTSSTTEVAQISTVVSSTEPPMEVKTTVTVPTTEVSTDENVPTKIVSSTEPPMEAKTAVTVPTTEVSTEQNVAVKNNTTKSPKPDPEVLDGVNKLAEMEPPMEQESSVETDHVASSYTHVVRKIFKRPFGFLNPSIRPRKKYSVPVYTKSVVSQETNVLHPKIRLRFPSSMTPGTRSRSYAHATAYSNQGNYHATVVADTETDV